MSNRNAIVGDAAFLAILGETDPRGREAVGDHILSSLSDVGYELVEVMPHEALKGLKPLVVYFGNDEDREEFIAAIHEVKPNMRTIKL